MRRRRKDSRGKLIGLLALAVVAVVIFALLPGREPEERNESTKLVAEGTFAGRKNIYDRRHRELAVSLRLTSVYARPLELREPEMIAGQFAAILEQDEKELLRALGSERSFIWLARRLDAEKSARISGLKTRGLYFFDEEQRFYPNRESGAHVLGFLDKEQGLAGIEFYYEHLLQGGWSAEQDMSPELPSSVDREKGAHLVLTLDLPVQVFLEQELAALQKKTGAGSAMALVMEPDSGEIHALVSLPAFDPNLFWRSSTAERRNRILTEPLFPGSLRDIFRLAAAVESGRVGEEENDEVVPLLTARRVKRTQHSTGVLHADWVELAPGVYATPSLGRLPDFELSETEFAGFAALMGLSGDPELDLPRGLEKGEAWGRPAAGDGPGETAPTTALQLLAAFSRLTTSGETSRPHLLKALLNEERAEAALLYEKRPPLVGAAARQAVFSILFSTGSGRSAGMIESLLHRPLKAGNESEKRAAARECLHQSVLLGLIPGSPRFTFLLALDEACIDLSGPSPLRLLGERFSSRFDQLRQEGAPGSAGKSGEEIYHRWRDLHQQQGEAEERPARRDERMADLRGLGLRQALRILQPYGLEVEISGSGRVVSQQPEPGRPLAGAGKIKLELRADHE